jgi:hypothetical protein
MGNNIIDEIENAYDQSQREYHNCEEWGDDQWDRVYEALEWAKDYIASLESKIKELEERER